MTFYCAKCGDDITNRSKRVLNIEDDEKDLEIVCSTCYRKANRVLVASLAAAVFAIRNPQLASDAELLDCLVHKDVDLDDRIRVVDELRKRLRDDR